MHIEQPPRIAAHGQQRHRASTEIGQLKAKARQLRLQVIEDAVAADLSRRISGVEGDQRSEEHTSELQSLMRTSSAVFCLKNKEKKTNQMQSHRHKSNRV